jgi:hypothetical protein
VSSLSYGQKRADADTLAALSQGESDQKARAEMKIIDVRVWWPNEIGYANNPELKLLVDRIPMTSELKFESIQVPKGVLYLEIVDHRNNEFILEPRPSDVLIAKWKSAGIRIPDYRKEGR